MSGKRYNNQGDNDTAQQVAHVDHDHDHDHGHQHGSNASLVDEMQEMGPIEQVGSWLSNLFGGGQRDEAIDTNRQLVNERNRQPSVPYTISEGRVSRNFQFNGVRADAHVYTIVFEDGVELPIYAPAAPDENLHYHTVAEAALAASHLPLASRRRLTSIMLNPIENPQDEYWAAEYNRPDFHSYMTAGGAGQITIYPDDSRDVPGMETMKSSMVHETGHVWSYQAWGNDKTRGGWRDWAAAMTADGQSLSRYADSSIAEDVAETVQAYSSTQGTRRHDEYRRVVPNRFAVLDRDFR